MGTGSPHSHGLRPTLRQGMILVLWLALLFAALAAVLKPGRVNPDDAILSLYLLIWLSPLVLGQLVAWLDRPGPARTWLASVCRSMSYLFLGGFLIWQALDAWRKGESSESRNVVLGLGVASVVGFVLILARLRPTRCPRCLRRTVVPQVRWFARDEPHTTQAGQCVSCGQRCTRKPGEPWSARPEPAMPPWQGPDRHQV